MGKHVYIILECSLKNLSLKLSLEHFKKLVSLPHLMLYVFLSIFDYYRLLSIAIVLKYYFHYHYHYHYRSKSHYRTSLFDFIGRFWTIFQVSKFVRKKRQQHSRGFNQDPGPSTCGHVPTSRKCSVPAPNYI